MYLALKPESITLIGALALVGVLGSGCRCFGCRSSDQRGRLGRGSQRAVFDLLMLLGTLILPLLAALPIKVAGLNPLDYTTPAIIRAAIVIGVMYSGCVGTWRLVGQKAVAVACSFVLFLICCFLFHLFHQSSGNCGRFYGCSRLLDGAAGCEQGWTTFLLLCTISNPFI